MSFPAVSSMCHEGPGPGSSPTMYPWSSHGPDVSWRSYKLMSFPWSSSIPGVVFKLMSKNSSKPGSSMYVIQPRSAPWCKTMVMSVTRPCAMNASSGRLCQQTWIQAEMNHEILILMQCWIGFLWTWDTQFFAEVANVVASASAALILFYCLMHSMLDIMNLLRACIVNFLIQITKEFLPIRNDWGTGGYVGEKVPETVV